MKILGSIIIPIPSHSVIWKRKNKAGTMGVEGDWNGFVFRLITKEDYPAISKNLRRVFCRDEPLMKLSECANSEDMMSDLVSLMISVLDQGDNISFVALDRKTGEIAAIRITYKVTSADPKGLSTEFKSSKMKNILSNLIGIGKETNLFELYGIDFYADLFCTSVNPEYRGKGLVTEIYKRSFNLLREEGYPVCKSIFTNPVTYKLGLKFGFEEHAHERFSDFKDEDGSTLLPNAPADQEGILMTLKL